MKLQREVHGNLKKYLGIVNYCINQRDYPINFEVLETHTQLPNKDKSNKPSHLTAMKVALPLPGQAESRFCFCKNN
jgi:hypothetical protein